MYFWIRLKENFQNREGAGLAPDSIPDHSPPCTIELKAKIGWCLLEWVRQGPGNRN